jgi:hypothetical protein
MKEERAARIYDGSDRLIFGELNNYQLFNAFSASAYTIVLSGSFT